MTVEMKPVYGCDLCNDMFLEEEDFDRYVFDIDIYQNLDNYEALEKTLPHYNKRFTWIYANLALIESMSLWKRIKYKGYFYE